MTDPSGVPREVDLDLPVEPESLDQVQDALERFWDGSDVSTVDRIRFETAVVEVAGNVVEHAYSFDQLAGNAGVRELAVRFRLGADVVEAVISDNGLPMEIDLAAVTMPGEEAESGRGLALAVAAVDELRYERDGGRNRWTMICRRTAG